MTTLGPSLTVTGDITSQEDIVVHGTVKGTITMQQGARVIAPQGTVAGDLSASDKLELAETAKVSGTIMTPSLVLRDGAVFNGMVDMATQKAKAAVPNVAAAVGESAKKAS